MELPVFTYHPDPVATGAVVRSPNQCVVCKQSREFVYVGPTYSEEEIAEESICPWCIADGSANQRFGVEFTDSALIGDGLAGTGPVSVEIIGGNCASHTGVHWLAAGMLFTHCGDGGAFLGAVGRAELEQFGPDAVAAVRESTGLEGRDWNEFVRVLHRDGSPCAYLFRCRHCGQFGGYTDSD